MTSQCYYKIAIYFILYVIFFLSAKTFAEDQRYYDTWEFQLSDDAKLIWYYNTRKDFLANQPNRVLVNDKEFVMRADVRPPMMNGLYLLKYSRVNEGEEVLDLGTGSGLHAIFAAEKAKHVVATDIYSPAIVNAKINAKLHGLEDKIDFRIGDLFEPLKEGEKFDVFFININFPYSVGDSDRRRLHERIFSQIRQHMKPNARIYYQTSYVRNIPYIYDMLDRNELRIMEMHMIHETEKKHEPLFLMVQSRNEP